MATISEDPGVGVQGAWDNLESLSWSSHIHVDVVLRVLEVHDVDLLVTQSIQVGQVIVEHLLGILSVTNWDLFGGNQSEKSQNSVVHIY
jgi:hypothetical protein